MFLRSRKCSSSSIRLRRATALLGALLLGVMVGSVRGAEADVEPTTLDESRNFHRISGQLLTSGQIYPTQIADLQSRDVGLVLNLAVADEERNGPEALAVTGAGISYVHIPVLWDAPTREDLELFFAMMDARGDRKTLVHCFANYRASAFTFLYRVLKAGVPIDEAREDLYAVWTDEVFSENPVWRTFITETLEDAGLTL